MTLKAPFQSRVEMTEIVLPAHTNRFGTVFGGTVMAWIDVCAAVAAMRHAGGQAVTASMDQLHFLSGARVGEIVVLQAQVNSAARTSMEVGVRVESEDPNSGERKHTASAYLTFVAVDETGRPRPVPGLKLETNEDQRRFAAAEIRRAQRLSSRESILGRTSPPAP